MRRAIISMLFILLGAVIFCIFAYHVSGTGARGAFEIPGLSSHWAYVITAISGFSAMLIGVLLGSLYRILMEKKLLARKMVNGWALFRIHLGP